MIHIDPKYKIHFRKVIVIIIAWMTVGILITLYDYFLLYAGVSLVGGEYYSFIFSLIINVGAGFTSGLIYGSILVPRTEPAWGEKIS